MEGDDFHLDTYSEVSYNGCSVPCLSEHPDILDLVQDGALDQDVSCMFQDDDEIIMNSQPSKSLQIKILVITT